MFKQDLLFREKYRLNLAVLIAKPTTENRGWDNKEVSLPQYSFESYTPFLGSCFAKAHMHPYFQLYQLSHYKHQKLHMENL